MAEDVYRKVQRQLDQYSIGFPETESGVEIEILKLLFDEKDAELFSEMTGELETPRSIADRTGRRAEEVAEDLERLAKKGLLYRVREAESVKYSAIPFIHGLLEFQAPWMPKELVKLTGKYIREKLKDNMAGGKGMRVLPVKESVDFEHEVASYDDACEILKKEELIAVTECSCRLQRKLFDRACDSPLDNCIMVGPMAEYYIENDMGRQITLDEAMKIMEESHAAGLVTQTQSVTRPFMICNCCKCCCGFLGAVRRTPKPAQLVISNHIARVDPARCSGCEDCIDNCQVQAIAMNADGAAEIDYDRCIGCGLCISACSDDALSLVAKPEEKRDVPVENLHEQLVRATKRRRGEEVDEKQVVSFGFDQTE
jgi:Na+-translocating ferredoxin:NAD+ oxidoreductase RNF subunit RnfB